MQNERKSFQNLPGHLNPQFLEDGKKIYLEMKNKYPNKSSEDLDNILNGLCVSLTCLMYENVSKDDRKQFVHLIYKIISDNA
jgi:hypothetical protein